jgi:hypothetical protein
MRSIAPLALLAAALGLTRCDPVRQFCNSDSDCDVASNERCDIGQSPPGQCRSTCSAGGIACSPSTVAPYPVGDNSGCQPEDQCVCNPVVGAFFCEPQ